MTVISCLLEVLRQDLVLGVQTVGVEPAHPAPLETQAVGVVPGQQGRAGRRTLRVEVGLVEDDACISQVLKTWCLDLVIMP